ncbi:MAG: HAMP domain-containing histidine kinase [Clostridiales bacterium]|nr:HAMP domain-containing histidine kinase [Clostridiales bacterium]
MKTFKLLTTLVITMLITLHIGLFTSSGAIYLLSRFGIITFNPSIAWVPLFELSITACCISAVLTAIVTRKLLAPLHQLADSMEQVAAGDFSVRLSEDNPGLWMHDVNVNFNKMVTELNSTELLQSDFIQNVSHEIKTPLAAMDGYATLLLSTELNSEQRQYASRISASCQKLSSLTGNILLLSKLENQQIVSEKTNFSLDEQIRQVILSAEPLWSARSQNIDLELPEVTCYGREYLIWQIWGNLLSNAIKFTPQGGVISVRISEDPAAVHVSIQDTGIGMTEDVLAHIFDKFYQAEGSRSTHGNGLGLSLVKKIVDLCNGEILVESEPDIGSTFTVVLPKSDTLI